MSEDDLRAAMRKRFQAMTMNEWCKLTGCNKTHVSEFVRGLRLPPGDMLKALNMRMDYIKIRQSKDLT